VWEDGRATRNIEFTMQGDNLEDLVKYSPLMLAEVR